MAGAEGGLLEDLAERWELELGERHGDSAAWFATRAGSRPVVLKFAEPDERFEELVSSFMHWDGHGVVDLIDHDPRGAMLLERALPGTSLLEEPDEDRAMLVAADVLDRLWVPDPGGVESVADEVGRWADSLPRRNRSEGSPIDHLLVDRARELLRDLAPTQREAVLLHGDLHLGNVLAAEREPWLAIDPKPLVGEREFDVTALIRDKQEELVAEADAGRKRVQHRFDLLSDRLSCDRDRLQGWSFAIMVDYALWCFELDDEECGSRQAALARILAEVRP
jgi:streptomycin 6-kinase